MECSNSEFQEASPLIQRPAHTVETSCIDCGSKLVYVENYGCASNKHDLEIMLALLSNAGYLRHAEASSSDIILINTCAVKKPTEDRILSRLGFLSTLNKPIVISGCLPKINLDAVENAAPNYAAAIDPFSISQIVEVARAAERGERGRRYFSDRPVIKPILPHSRLNRFIEIVEVAEGCAGVCAYCCVRFARGKLHSYPQDMILNRIQDAIQDGAIEIWLTGQDIGAYGKDIGAKLTDLVRRVVEIPGEFRVRLGMMNPNWVGGMLGEILDLYMNPKIYKFAHLPVQSGSDAVLETMLRPYRVRDFVEIVEALRENIPQIAVATDMIVGFPTERDEDFALSLELVRKTRPDIVNISKYAPRAGTAASRMKELPVSVVSERSKLLSSICAQLSLESNLRMIGFEECVYVAARNSKGKSIGRTSNYKIVILQDASLLGKKILTKISGAGSRYLEGTFLGFDHGFPPDNHRENINTTSPKTAKVSDWNSQILVKIKRGCSKPTGRGDLLRISDVLQLNYATLYRLGQFVCYLPRS